MPRRLQKRLSLAIFFSTCSLLNLAAVDDSEVLFVCVYGDQTDADEDLFPREVTSQKVSPTSVRIANMPSYVRHKFAERCLRGKLRNSAIIYSRIILSILFHKNVISNEASAIDGREYPRRSAVSTSV